MATPKQEVPQHLHWTVPDPLVVILRPAGRRIWPSLRRRRDGGGQAVGGDRQRALAPQHPLRIRSAVLNPVYQSLRMLHAEACIRGTDVTPQMLKSTL